MNEFTTEIAKLEAAVDDAAREMKQRLHQKVSQGFTGWDGKFPESGLMDRLTRTTDEIVINQNFSKLIDLLCWAMFLWYRKSPRTSNHYQRRH